MPFETLIFTATLVAAFPTAVLATWQAGEIWRHGSIFSTWRAWLEASESFMAGLLLCPFCLSPWLALIWCSTLVIGLWQAASGQWWISIGVQLPAWSLAVARLANLGNDLLHAWCRTPKE